MKKILVFTAILSNILLVSCSDPCEKYSKFKTDEHNGSFSCDDFDCAVKIDLKDEQLKRECNSHLAGLVESDRSKAILKCEDEYISETDACRKMNEKLDELLEYKSSSAGSEWKAKICSTNEYALSTFTINGKDKTTNYIMLDFLVTEETIADNTDIKISGGADIKSSGRDVKDGYDRFVKNITNSNSKYDLSSEIQFLKEDYGRIIWTLDEKGSLPDIQNLSVNVYGAEIDFSVDSSWSCTDVSAKEVFEKKKLVPGVRALVLTIAKAKDSVDDIKKIIASGVDVNAKATFGDTETTPLDMAVTKGNIEVIKVLIDAGADVNARIKSKGDNGERTPLGTAVLMKNIEAIKVLIDAGADVNFRFKSGESETTLLFAAVFSENVEIVKLFINSGADVNAKMKNQYGEFTPYDVAMKAGQFEIADIIRAKMGDNAQAPTQDKADDNMAETAPSPSQNAGNAQPSLTFVRDITYKNQKKPSWIIFKDGQDRFCAVVTSSKYQILQETNYCIPFSGNDDDLKDSFAGNRIAEIDYPEHKQCKNVKTQSDNDYCNRFYQAFIQMATRENFVKLKDLCQSDEDLKKYCEYMN